MSEIENSLYYSENDSSNEVELKLYDNNNYSELNNENDENDNGLEWE